MISCWRPSARLYEHHSEGCLDVLRREVQDGQRAYKGLPVLHVADGRSAARPCFQVTRRPVLLLKMRTTRSQGHSSRSVRYMSNCKVLDTGPTSSWKLELAGARA